MGKTLIRPDGSTIRVDNEVDAQKLMTLGYREESPGLELERGMEMGQEEHYTTIGQKLLTAGEGALSGLTLGGSDLLLDGEDTQERAKRNPGVRLASELAGSLAPSVIPGLGLTPAGLLTKGAERAAALGRGSATIRAGIRGVVEGAGIGANQAITDSQMAGDPLTAETILAGVGWGALYGGGISALGSKVATKFEERAAKAAAEKEAALTAPTQKEIHTSSELDQANRRLAEQRGAIDAMKGEHEALTAVEDTHYGPFQNTVADATEQLNRAKKTVVEADVEGLVKQAEESVRKPKMEFRPLNADFTAFESSLIDSGNIKLVRQEMRSTRKALGKVISAAERGDYRLVQEGLEEFSDRLTGVTDSLGGPGGAAKMIKGADAAATVLEKYHEELAKIGDPIREAAAKTAKEAAEEVAKITSVQAELSKFPRKADEFANMTGKRVEKLGAAMDQLTSLKSAELAGVQESVKTALDSLKAGLGVELEGTPGQQVRGIWELLKDARSKRAQDFAKATNRGDKLWERTQRAEDRVTVTKASRVAETEAERTGRAPWVPRYLVGSWAASKAGGGMKSAAAYATGSWLVGALMGMKGAVMGTISEKANKWLPRAGKAAQKYGPRVEPLATRIDGMADDHAKNRQELMKRRAQEITQAAPAVRDTLYRAVQPLGISNPALAAQMHAHAVERFQFLLSKMPKDPGLAYSNLRSLWKPDNIAVEKFSRYYEVFQNPVAVAVRAIETGRITLEAAEGLKNMNPEIFNYLRSAMLSRIADPEVSSKMTYSDQVHMGMLLDLPLHSTMDPRFIAPQQQMYTERNQPLEMNPRITPGGGGGRPAGPGPSATSAQRTTEH